MPGALLSLGDAHTSQGDSEFDGTAIETSLTATLKITLHKKGSLPKVVSKLNFPLLENANEYVVHGFTYNVRPLYLTHPPLDLIIDTLYRNGKEGGTPASLTTPDRPDSVTCVVDIAVFLHQELSLRHSIKKVRKRLLACR